MTVPLHIVDAFTDRAFAGNPAAVCLLDRPADEGWMQAVAAEMNLSETAFCSPRTDGDHDLRWFTPTSEVDLCGHATLATTHAMGADVRFHTRSGLLTCTLSDDGSISLDLPAAPVRPVPDADLATWAKAVGVSVEAVLALQSSTAGWTLLEVRRAADVRAAQPTFDRVIDLGGFVTLVADTTGDPDEEFDSVCRNFAPGAGVGEDPVTGASHCVIAPWLAERTGRAEFLGHQASRRGGSMAMRVDGNRVHLTGRAVTVVSGVLLVDPQPV